MKRDKTPLMLLKELVHDKPIDELLSGPSSEVAELLEIDKSTVTVWRQKREIYSPGYCYTHKQRVLDFCHQCWLERLGMNSENAKEVVDEMCQE